VAHTANIICSLLTDNSSELACTGLRRLTTVMNIALLSNNSNKNCLDYELIVAFPQMSWLKTATCCNCRATLKKIIANIARFEVSVPDSIRVRLLHICYTSSCKLRPRDLVDELYMYDCELNFKQTHPFYYYAVLNVI
jgi:hypothetical protein